ncbi:type II toxin-antitoxin system HigB family toxin [Candidatus Binatus sp.]|uniref:type II toxin-antitoxin system HigB family toxin n=1 Tax=Candidatus Binatus sp. TaxID=2811406 RepID=UPI00351D2700
MHVISRKALTEFWKVHAGAEAPLKTWFKAARRGSFKNLAELKQTFKSVDYVSAGRKGFYVFDIGGNKYRLIAAIHFNTQKLFIRHVLTHAQYDKGDWKK